MLKAEELIQVLERYKGYDVKIQLDETNEWFQEHIRFDSTRVTKELSLIIDFKDFEMIDKARLAELQDAEQELLDGGFNDCSCHCCCCN